MKKRDLQMIIDDLNDEDEIFFINRASTVYEVFEKVFHNGRLLMVLKSIVPDSIPQPEPVIENDFGGKEGSSYEAVVPEELRTEKKRGRPRKKEGDPTSAYVRKKPIDQIRRPKKKTKTRVSMKRKQIIKPGEII